MSGISSGVKGGNAPDLLGWEIVDLYGRRGPGCIRLLGLRSLTPPPKKKKERTDKTGLYPPLWSGPSLGSVRCSASLVAWEHEIVTTRNILRSLAAKMESVS